MENKNEIKYQDWPESVKLVTALSNENFYLKNAGIPNGLGLFLIIVGIASLGYDFFGSEKLTLLNIMSSLGSILIGVANIISGYVLKWIADNSSWEERFKNKSSIVYKFGNILFILVLIGCLFISITF